MEPDIIDPEEIAEIKQATLHLIDLINQHCPADSRRISAIHNIEAGELLAIKSLVQG